MDNITAEEARALVKQEKAARVSKCAAEIEAVLKAHECRLEPVPQITQDGRVVAVVKVIAE